MAAANISTAESTTANENVTKAADENKERGKESALEGVVGKVAPEGNVDQVASETTPLIPVIDVDEGGTYKYVLCKLNGAPPNIKGVVNGMFLVRGHEWASYHADLVEEVESYIQRHGIKFSLEVTGGGRIAFNRDRQTIMVYGYSMGYGRANHSITCELLRRQFPNYTIDWQNSGY